MTFFTKKNGLSVETEHGVLFSGLQPWGAPDAMQDKIYPACVKLTETEALFDDGNGFSLTLTLENHGDVFALRLKADYNPIHLAEDQRFATKFQQEYGLGIHFDDIENRGVFVANYMGCEFWCQTHIHTDIKTMPNRTQALLWQTQGHYGYITPVCDKIYKVDLGGNENGGFDLRLTANVLTNKADTYTIFASFGDDPYTLPSEVTGFALKKMEKKGKLRKERRYPEVFEYLGWCSWDAFHMDVTHDDLLAKAQEFKEKEIPVRWMIIDDMWGHVPNINRKTMHSRMLYSFEADPIRFPKGLKGVITELKEKFGQTVGMWHPTTGYWAGIDPDGDIARDLKDTLITVNTAGGPGATSIRPKMIHSPEKDKAFTYYNTQHAFYKDCGAEFVKVDNQSFIRKHYRDIMPIGEVAENLHDAIEASVGANFDGAIINCMCMANENFWNRPQSAVCRFSGDFQPENRLWFIKHLIQCSYNALFQGTLYTGDWDMWWSDDAQASKNAVLRAMSGGPVYMSDELHRSIKETIMPIVLRDGRIIRCEDLATPTPDCLFEDAPTSGKIFKVQNHIHGGGAIAAFNMDQDENPVSGKICITDIPTAQKGSYAVYDFFNKTVSVLSDTDEIDLTLQNYDDFRLYLFVPITDGKAAIGLWDKYMAPNTYEIIGPHVYRVKEGGTFAIYSEKPLSHVDINGESVDVKEIAKHIYTADIPHSEKIILII